MQRADGSLTYQVDMSKLGDVKAPDVLRLLQTSIEDQLATLPPSHPEASHEDDRRAKTTRETLSDALEALQYNESGNTDSLDTILETLVVCARAKQSLILGFLPRSFTSGVFTLTFKDIERKQNGDLDVPCLSLVHDDTMADPPIQPGALREHLQEVRDSYWVCLVSNTAVRSPPPYNAATIEHTRGTEVFNTLSREGLGVDKKIVGFEEHEYGNGVDSTPLLTWEEYNKNVDRLQFDDVSRIMKAAITVMTSILADGKLNGMWADKKKPESSEVDFRFGNLVGMRVGTSPISTLTLKSVDWEGPVVRAPRIRSRSYFESRPGQTAWTPSHPQPVHRTQWDKARFVRVLLENAGAEDAYKNDPTRPEKRINPTEYHGPSYRSINPTEDHGPSYRSINPTEDHGPSYRSLGWGLGGQ
jgi:hypothetical protein